MRTAVIARILIDTQLEASQFFSVQPYNTQTQTHWENNNNNNNNKYQTKKNTVKMKKRDEERRKAKRELIRRNGINGIIAWVVIKAFLETGWEFGKFSRAGFAFEQHSVDRFWSSFK